MAKGRAIIKRKGPYYLTVTNKFIPVEVPGKGTLGVTKGGVLYFDPDWLMAKSPEKVAGLLVHEAHHVMRGHHDRIWAMLKDLYSKEKQDGLNVAADLAQNDHIVDSGFELPEDGQFAEGYGFPKYLMLEEYWRLLQQQGGCNQSKGKGAGCGHCGGVAGNPEDFEEELDKQFQGGRSTREMKEASRQALQGMVAHGRGKSPGWAQELLKADATVSVIPWETKLSSHFTSLQGQLMTGGTDYTYERQSRRSLLHGSIINPALVAREFVVAVIVDTSGSMNAKLLGRAYTESRAILRRLGIEKVWHIQADTHVANKPEMVQSRKLVAPAIFGRGGTSFDDALSRLPTLRPRPHMAVYFTDGFGAITKRPKIPTIFGVIGEPDAYHREWIVNQLSPHGRLVHIKE